MLVFHGVNGLGWEALPDTVLQSYFQYIKQHEDDLWVATFKDVAKYMRERMHADITENKSNKKITVHLTHSLDKHIYNMPLTLKTYVPAGWKKVKVIQDGQQQQVQSKSDEKGNYILYEAMPDKGEINLSQL